MKSTLKNIFTQAAKPSRFNVMAGKVISRIIESNSEADKQENLRWIKENLGCYETYASNINPGIWLESKTIGEEIATRAEDILREIEYDLGGGGIYTFLYFIARLTQPKNVVETGVAAGFSSYAILAALEKNKKGKLFSSDFPYFRLPNPEKYIGVVVPDELKKNWSLFIEGDEKNLPKIMHEVDTVDLFHYDSDKSNRGREYALSLVSEKLSENAVILMDDIQDNFHFCNLVKKINSEEWRIFEFNGKYVGMVGKLV